MSRKLVWPKIYIFGDSLTQFSFSKDGGWASIVADAFQRRADIVARGFSGYNTRQCRALLPYLDNDFSNVSIAAVLLGANDANDPIINPQQSVPVAEYKENLKYIVNYLQTTGKINPVFIITPPTLDEEKWHDFCDTAGITCGNKASLVAQYAAACMDIAKEIGVKCLDIHTPMIQQNDYKEMFNDGLHFSPKGSEFFASKLLPLLETLMEENKIGGEEELMPLWNCVSNTDPDSSLKEWMETHQ